MNVLATVGAGALITALATSLFSCVAATVGLRARRPGLTVLARRAWMTTAAFTSLAFGTLVIALLRDDFSLAYVASVSSREMETPMKWAALWSSQSGSLLYWTWVMSILMAVFAWVTLPRIPWGAPHATALGSGVLAAFIAALVFLASPFEVSRITPDDGIGLNPLLVDKGMLIHPPFLLGGLVSTSIPFVLGGAALLSARIDNAWLRSVRHWALLSWLVLSIGNFLGGWWAYSVLGWGGYWGWDPVENSAMLPLLPMTAFLHSMMVQERRGMLKLWNLALVAAAFGLAVFGTFNVRSGLVESVHSFAKSDVGSYFLVLLGIVVVLSIVLLVWRGPYLKPDHDFDSLLSRESGLIVNNYLLTAIALIVLGGTLFPVFSELFDNSRITVGPPFYNRVVGPLLIGLVVLAAIGTVLPWRQAAPGLLLRRFRTPVAVLVVSLVILGVLGMHDPFALAGTGSAIVLLYVTAREYFLGARGARRARGADPLSSFFGLFSRDRRRYGGYLVHIGFGVMAIAIIGSNVYQEQVRTTVAPGGSFEAGGRTLTYKGLRERTGTSNGVETEIVAPVEISKDGKQVGYLEPGRRLFKNFPQQPMGIVAMDSSLRDDLYVFVQGWDSNGVAEFHVFVNPLIIWLWIGGAIYVVGGLIAFAPVGVRAPEPVRLPSPAVQHS
ncbi:MAG: cytochrome c-type biogenesis CcmF C-terminal domain-containing protein [Dehalococcoidia bacterium]